jgi:hypothetical protein
LNSAAPDKKRIVWLIHCCYDTSILAAGKWDLGFHAQTSISNLWGTECTLGSIAISQQGHTWIELLNDEAGTYIHSVPRSMIKTTHPQNPTRTNRVSQMINAGLDLPDTQFVQSDLKGKGKRELHFPLHHSKKRKTIGVSCWFSNSVLHFELSRSWAV